MNRGRGRGGGGSGSGGRGTGSGSGSGGGRDNTWKKIRDAVLRPFSCFTATSNLEPASTPADMPPPPPPQDEPPTSARGRGAARGDPSSTWDPTTAPGDQSLPPVPTWDPPVHRRTESESTKRARECMVCLEEMKTGDAETGDVLYTGACGHAFHFLCVVNLVAKSRRIDCPVCRKQWKIIPALPPKERKELALQALKDQMGSSTPRQGGITIRSPSTFRSPSTNRAERGVSMPPPLESFNDDEIVEQDIPDAVAVADEIVELESTITDIPDDLDGLRSVSINTHTQMSAVPGSSAINTFAVVLHLKAPGLVPGHKTSRAPVDLVAVLDISGTMVGSKIMLLKQAMQFVIEKLGKNDRLSVVSFASESRRLFPLLRMTDNGQHQALRAVNALEANGGTNIARGLRIGAKVVEDRRESNRVAYILLFSDGRDTDTLNNGGFSETQEKLNYKELLPSSIIPEGTSGFKIPVHTFGFGADHDAAALHTISEVSGGTFSFIEHQAVIEVAFAQCIGGLLSVVARDLYVRFECLNQEVLIGSIETGNYPNHIFPNQRAGAITVGNVYADEVRDFLVLVNVPVETSSNETNLLRVGCVYTDPLTNTEQVAEASHARIERTDVARQEDVSIEVDRQQNRIHAAEAMAQARTAAEDGDLENAASTLENARKALLETASARSQDQLCIFLAAELKKLQENMANRPVYERSGRALILSGLSSHSWQRATARGDLIESPTSLFWTYQTPSSTQR